LEGCPHTGEEHESPYPDFTPIIFSIKPLSLLLVTPNTFTGKLHYINLNNFYIFSKVWKTLKALRPSIEVSQMSVSVFCIL